MKIMLLKILNMKLFQLYEKLFFLLTSTALKTCVGFSILLSKNR